MKLSVKKLRNNPAWYSNPRKMMFLQCETGNKDVIEVRRMI